jgi:hypothetical protein
VPFIPVLEGASAVVELRVVPEAAMVPFVASRLAEARKAQDRVATERERLGEEARAALARSDRADQEWKAVNEKDLYRRVEVLLRRPRDPAEVAAVHGDLLARKQVAYRRAVQAARHSVEKERALDAVERDLRRYRDLAFLIQGMPPDVVATRVDGTGSFEIDVPPGRYALVATVVPGAVPAATEPGWLLWVEVREGPQEPLRLDWNNRYGKDCDACIVSAKDLP